MQCDQQPQVPADMTSLSWFDLIIPYTNQAHVAVVRYLVLATRKVTNTASNHPRTINQTVTPSSSGLLSQPRGLSLDPFSIWFCEAGSYTAQLDLKFVAQGRITLNTQLSSLASERWDYRWVTPLRSTLPLFHPSCSRLHWDNNHPWPSCSSALSAGTNALTA